MNSLKEIFNALNEASHKKNLMFDEKRNILHLTEPDIRIYTSQNQTGLVIYFRNHKFQAAEKNFDNIYSLLSGIYSGKVTLSLSGKDTLRINGWKGNISSSGTGVLGTLSGLLGSRNKSSSDSGFTEIKSSKEKTASVSRKSIKINFNHGITPKLTDSKICGLPYWDLTKPYPTDKNGKKMLLLAQFNLSKIPSNNVLPSTGILQFFVTDTQMPDFSCKPRVVYHRVPDASITSETIKKLGIPVKTENSLFRTEYLLTFTEEKQPKSNGCHLLGVSASDPADTSDRTSYFNTHLLQLDTEDSYMRFHFNSFKEQTTGSFSFFINDEDLKNKDFSNVQMMWHTQFWNG